MNRTRLILAAVLSFSLASCAPQRCTVSPAADMPPVQDVGYAPGPPVYHSTTVYVTPAHPAVTVRPVVVYRPTIRTYRSYSARSYSTRPSPSRSGSFGGSTRRR